LNNIYTDIYQFVRVLGFSAEYVESISPNEREIYRGMYKEEMKERKKHAEGDNPMGQSVGTPIET